MTCSRESAGGKGIASATALVIHRPCPAQPSCFSTHHTTSLVVTVGNENCYNHSGSEEIFGIFPSHLMTS
jgi:hypothetical protein